MNNDELKDNISDLKDEIEVVVRDRIEITKLQVCQNTSRLFSNITTAMVIFYLASMILLFVSLACGLLIGKSLGYINGFFIIAGCYLLLTIMIFILRKKIIEAPIIKGTILIFFPKINNIDDE